MILTNANDGWLLAMDEGLVQRIEIDFRLGFLFADKSETASLYIETPCILKCDGRDLPVIPSKPLTVAPILSLFNAGVADITILGTGHLTVTFRDGRLVEVCPDAKYEAWQLGGASDTNSFLLVCAPGGGVSVFQKERKRATP